MTSRPTLKQLEILRAVVVSGSITNAARRKGLSQPSISQQIARLEETLGTPLLLRTRSDQVKLTAAGEYWYNTSNDLLWRYEAAIQNHGSRFAEKMTIRLGSTPTLRGRFTARAARIALDIDPGTRFEHYWGADSEELTQRLRMHQLNCAVIARPSIEHELSSFAVRPMFVDRLAWVVPREIAVEALTDALAGDDGPFRAHPALGRFAVIGPRAPLQSASGDWYRHHMPLASAVFTMTNYDAAIDIVSSGLATAHCPLSLLPSLPEAIRAQTRWFCIDEFAREMVMAMPKHLLSLGPYADFFQQLGAFTNEIYSAEMMLADVLPFSALESQTRRPGSSTASA